MLELASAHLIDAPCIIPAVRLEPQVLEAHIARKEPGHAIRSLPVVAFQALLEGDLQMGIMCRVASAALSLKEGMQPQCTSALQHLVNS